MGMHIELESLVAAPASRVFQFFADPRQRPRWQRSLSDVTLETSEAPQLGTRWRESPAGLGTVHMEITTFDPPHRWAERGVSRLGRLDLTLTFHPEGASTRVVLHADLALPRLLALGAALVKPLMAREIKNDLARAASILEDER